MKSTRATVISVAITALLGTSVAVPVLAQANTGSVAVQGMVRTPPVPP